MLFTNANMLLYSCTAEGSKKMEREREEQLYRLQAELCKVLAEPTRLKLLSLIGERPRPVKELVEATGERQAKISQHLAIMRQRNIVRTDRVGTEVHYSLTDPPPVTCPRCGTQEVLKQISSFATTAKGQATNQSSCAPTGG